MKANILTYLSFCILIAFCSCMHTESKKPSEKNVMKTKDESKLSEELQNLLDGINAAVLAGGDPEHPIEGLVSKGESNALFLEFKTRIEKRGYQLKWIDDAYEITLKN